jgi:MFS family permease
VAADVGRSKIWADAGRVLHRLHQVDVPDLAAGVAIACIAVSMFCMRFGITCKWILVTAMMPQAYTPSAASNQNFAGFLGGALSPILTGFIVDVTGSLVLALAIGAVITLIGAALFQFTMTTVIDEVELEKYAHAPA